MPIGENVAVLNRAVSEVFTDRVMFEQLPLGDLKEEHFRQKEQQVQVA